MTCNHCKIPMTPDNDGFDAAIDNLNGIDESCK
jgi:hypothetical protein